MKRDAKRKCLAILLFTKEEEKGVETRVYKGSERETRSRVQEKLKRKSRLKRVKRKVNLLE